MVTVPVMVAFFALLQAKMEKLQEKQHRRGTFSHIGPGFISSPGSDLHPFRKSRKNGGLFWKPCDVMSFCFVKGPTTPDAVLSELGYM
jgi:hypothetical protein